jgi:putative transposase
MEAEEQRWIETYSFEHGLDLKDLVNSYMRVVRATLDALWLSIRWEMRGSVWVPSLRVSKRVRMTVRSKYLRGWPYSRHYVDLAIKDANTIIELWMRKYMDGMASKEKPEPAGNYVKIIRPFFHYSDGTIPIPIKPNGECISIDLKSKPFWDRISASHVVKLRLEENKLTVIVRRDIRG